MIKVWRKDTPNSAKERLFNKINIDIKERLKGDLKEALPTKGAKDIATTMMSKKVGKNLYVSPSGRKYRRVTPNGKTGKGRTRHQK